MDQNDFSCMKQVTKTVQLTMPLKYTSNEIAGVAEILDSWKRQFVPKLQGVVVNYRDIRLARRTFFIHASRTAPLYDVTATFDLFCPSIGDIVKGRINRSSREHIGCLIEGIIHATIHLPSDSSPNLSKYIRNRNILFQINRFEFNRHTIRVNGEITPECIKLMDELFLGLKDVPENKSNGLTNSISNFHDGTSHSITDESSCDQYSYKLESISKNPATNLNLDSSSNADTSSDESKLCKTSTATDTMNESYQTAIHASIQEATEANLYENPSIHSQKLLISKKRKRDSEPSLNSPTAFKKKRKNSEFELEDETLLLDASEPLTLNKKKKKKHKEKSTLSADLASNMVKVADFESKFAGLDSYNSSDTLLSVKREVVSPTNSPVSITEKEKKGEKRKRESSTSSVNESPHKSKHTKKHKKDKKKSKSSKIKGTLVTAGDILKKDKKKSKSKKNKKGGEEDVGSIGVPVSIKSELN